MLEALRRSARVCSRGALIAALLLPATAAADAIDGPPACPPGARGYSAHAGQWCVPWTCTADADCGGQAACRPWRVCTRESDVVPGGMRPEPSPPQRMTLVVGTCDPAAACRGDEEPPPEVVGKFVEGAPKCVEANHCVPADLPALPSRAGETAPPPGAGPGPAPVQGTSPTQASATPPGCGCAATNGAPAGLIFALWFSRRRRR
jgi:hypothetical protein